MSQSTNQDFHSSSVRGISLSAVYIYGPPGSGKSALGRCLSENLNLPFYDLDEIIEIQAGKSIPEIFADEGESGFRRRERAAFGDVLRSKPGVVALGGGALLDVENRTQAEATGRVLCLSAPFETLLERAKTAEGQRPLLAGEARERLDALLAQRKEHYASFPMKMDTADKSLEDAVGDAQVRLGMFRVSGMGNEYDVRVQAGGIGHLGEALMARNLRGPLALVSDENVARLYAARLLAGLQRAGYRAQTITIPAGEAHKTTDTILRMWEAFLEAGLERGSTVIALGGGVVGDLAGFAAATYLRGVSWVVLPTTVLAMCDASLGGKTGADLPWGKNLVGAFHSPRLVMADPETLATLPEVERRNGLAEVIKHGVIGDLALFELCSKGWDAIQADWGEVVRRAMAVKIEVIQDDPFEGGRRATLNLGHTLGHALELASDFHLKHGEAVAIGMVAAARLAERIGIAEAGLAGAIVAALRAVGLPTEIPDSLERGQILRAMMVDKKRARGKVRFVLPIRIGEVRWGVEVEEPGLILRE